MLIIYLAVLVLSVLFSLHLIRMAHSRPEPLPIPAKCCECCQDQKLEVERPVI